MATYTDEDVRRAVSSAAEKAANRIGMDEHREELIGHIASLYSAAEADQRKEALADEVLRALRQMAWELPEDVCLTLHEHPPVRERG